MSALAVVISTLRLSAQASGNAGRGLELGGGARDHHKWCSARLWYRVAGNQTSPLPPVVFLHGGRGYNSYSFSMLEGPRLEGALRMVYFDQRGSGHSERPTTGRLCHEHLGERR